MTEARTEPPDTAAYVDAIRTNTDALVDAAVAAGVDAAVPSCPEWTVADLLGHVGRLQRWVGEIIERRSLEQVRFREIEGPPDGEARVQWVRDGAVRFVARLQGIDPNEAVWTFVPVGPNAGTIGFWTRRQAHEMAVHRYDAQLAAGTTAPVDAELAADGIDELLTALLPVARGEALTGTGETVHVHCTDRDGEWVVRLTPAGPEVERAHAKSDVAVRGRASDLFLLLHNRLDPTGLEIFGDHALLDRFRSIARL